MKRKKFLQSFRFEADTGRKIVLSNTILSVVLAVSLYGNFISDTIVIQKANPYCEDMTLGVTSIDIKSQQRLSVLVSEAMGSVSPENSGFKRQIVLDYASPKIYQKVKDLTDLSFEELTREKISINFTPEKVYTETDGVTYVTGSVSIIGPTGVTRRSTRTYEFKWSVSSYSPTFDFVNVYDDSPKDSEWRRKQLEEEERRRSRD